MSEPIVFYDIVASSVTAWSPNTWKVRYALNIKGIPYKTIWVEYPDIEALCKKLGVHPTVPKLPDGSGPLYTLPVIHDPNTKSTIVDSAAIVHYLDKTYPTHGPALIPAGTDALHVAFTHAFASTAAQPMLRIMMPATYDVLDPRSQAYFKRTREAWFKCPLDELAPKGSARRREIWDAVRDGFGTVAKWLPADEEERLLFGGEQIIYADVTVAAFLKWMEIILGQESEEWKDVLTWDGGRWARFLSKFDQYGAVDVGSKLTDQ